MVPGEIAQQFLIRRVYRNLRTALQNIPGGPCDILALHQHGNRFASSVQSPVNHLGAFRNEEAFGWLKPVQQLGFGQPGVYVQFRGGKVRDLNYHTAILSPFQKFPSIIADMRQIVKNFPAFQKRREFILVPWLKLQAARAH